jgi:choice-of-anchor A domain-containing protein
VKSGPGVRLGWMTGTLRRTALWIVAATGLLIAIGTGVPGPPPAAAAVGECPPGYEPVGPINPGDPDFPPFTDDNVNVFAAGSFSVVQEAAEAEGKVVVMGDASFTRSTTGTYNVGVVGVGSGIVPPPDSEMLVVGGDLDGNAATTLDVGAFVGGRVTVGGTVQPGVAVETNGGTVAEGVADATLTYAGTVGLIGQKSAAWAALAPTGTVAVTPFSLTAVGDGTSDPQVFTVDATDLGTATRSLQFTAVPVGAAIYITLTGDAVELNINALLDETGTVVDPFSSDYFVDLTTRLMWNVPTAVQVGVGGSAQLPGSILVADPDSSTTITVPGTNGRVWVAGDLVHGGVGAEMHAYPFDPDEDLECKPLIGAITVDKVLDDPDGVVPPGRVFSGSVSCHLGGTDVTPDPATWSVTAGQDPVALANDVPVGAVCTLAEDALTVPPGSDHDWGPVTITPASVTVSDEEVLGFTFTNVVVPTTPPTTDPPTDPPTEPPTTTPPTEPPTTTPPTTLPPTVDPTTPTVEPTSPPGPSATSSTTDDPDVMSQDQQLPETGAPSGMVLLAALSAGMVLVGLGALAEARRNRRRKH